VVGAVRCDTRCVRRLAALLLLAWAGPAGAAPHTGCAIAGQLPAPPADRPHYALTVHVLEGLRTVDGTLAIRFAPERATDHLVFRLWANEPYLARLGAKLTVGAVRSAGQALPVTRPDPTTLVIERPLAAEEPIEVSMTWRLRLPRGDTDRMHGGSVARLGSFFPLLAWNPREGWALDPPSSFGAETWTSPSADFDVRVTAPPGLRVLASGEQVGRGRWHATAVRDFALAAGRFTVVRGTANAPGTVRVIVGVERGLPFDARRFLGFARSVLAAHSHRFGPYPWPTFTLAAMNDLGHHNWEYPTLTFQDSYDPGPAAASAHEIGHQWFYSLVGNNQARDPWLDEALASWAQARYSNALASYVEQQIPDSVRGQLGQPMSFWDRFDILTFGDGVYTQGVQALASLGDPAEVDCALRLYAEQNAYGIATPDDLLRALETFFPDARAKLEAYGARF
jgi:aminopeptidase N